jgi:hypothetical protein
MYGMDDFKTEQKHKITLFHVWRNIYLSFEPSFSQNIY